MDAMGTNYCERFERLHLNVGVCELPLLVAASTASTTTLRIGHVQSTSME